MPGQPPTKGGYVGVRLPSSSPLLTPPGPLGFADILEPDTAFDPAKFKVNWHFEVAAAELLIPRLDTAIATLWPQFQEAFQEAAKKNKKLKWMSSWGAPDGAVWLEEHQIEAQEGEKIQLPHIRIDNAAYFKDRDGNPKLKRMLGSDIHGEAVDLHELNPGMGSIVQVICQPSIFVSPLVKVPAFKLGLQGLRILKLVRRGGGGGKTHLGAASEEDLALLGSDFSADDLSAYSTAKPAKAAAQAESIRGESYAHEVDDEPDGYEEAF